MSKVPKWGVSTYHEQTKKHRPGRHKKNRNKHEKRMGKYLPKTGTFQFSYINLYIQYERSTYKSI